MRGKVQGALDLCNPGLPGHSPIVSRGMDASVKLQGDRAVVQLTSQLTGKASIDVTAGSLATDSLRARPSIPGT